MKAKQEAKEQAKASAAAVAIEASPALSSPITDRPENDHFCDTPRAPTYHGDHFWILS
ncbi:hypothetical protein [Streptosporangium sp. NBC_01756]|uniref:hypothetical protein n=1 Tax=Streptosporangium sp. NBC_01756 TaxID=2975950 RepID=UPI002DDB70FB|nr:hypothetical protein [Streptosporangium sp. NBC_01756]WSC86474.1 hypothetical protein OIE48_40035 [Streptosporangium sp. NBC_01756]